MFLRQSHIHKVVADCGIQAAMCGIADDAPRAAIPWVHGTARLYLRLVAKEDP